MCSNSKEHGEFISYKFKDRRGVRSYTLGTGFGISDIEYQIQNKDKLAYTGVFSEFKFK